MNKSGDNNRSVRNTKKRLREGLLFLLDQKPINQITVRELTELADINRGTFYFHYSDIYDMLHKTENEFLEQLKTVLNKKSFGGNEQYPVLRELLHFIKENSDMAKILLGKNTDVEFVKRLKTLLTEYADNYRKKYGDSSKESVNKYGTAFILAGSVGIIKMWLNSGMNESPDEIADITGRIITESLKNAPDTKE